MPIYLGNHKLKELYVGGNKIKEAYLGSTKIYSSAVTPTYEIWTNDTSTHTSSNGTSTYWNLNTPASTNYNYILIEFNVKMRIISSSAYGGFGGIGIYVSLPPDYSRAIDFKFTGSDSYFYYDCIYALSSFFTAWHNGNITNTTGTETDYSNNTYRYVRNSTYLSSLNTWYKVKYIFDQSNKKLYFYFGNNKIYLGYANLNMSSGDIVNALILYSSEKTQWNDQSEVSAKNIIYGGFPTLQAAIDY